MKTKQDDKMIEELRKLPLDYWDFKDDDTKEYTHGLHNYPAVMVCPISRNIIKLVRGIQPVTALLDPFSGSGTVVVEGMINGVPTVAGNDINPLALLLTKVKSTPLDCKKLKKEADKVKKGIVETIEKNKTLLEEVDDYIANELGLDISGRKGWGDSAPQYLKQFCSKEGLAIEIPGFKNIGYWFRPRVILELAIEKAAIEKVTDTDIRDFIFVAMSESIRLVSNRRNGEFKMFRMPPQKVLDFRPDVYGEFEKILTRNIEKMEEFVAKLSENGTIPQVSIFRNSACTLEDVPDDTYDLIVTSPPYGDSRTTVAYGEYSRLSLQWINLDNLTKKEIMGVDKSLMGGKKYRNGFGLNLKYVCSFYEDLDAAIKSSAQKTKKGGYHFWVVGNRTVKNIPLQTDVIISELAEQYGLETVYTIDRNIPNKVMSSLNSPTNESGKTVTTMTTEHIVVLRKN